MSNAPGGIPPAPVLARLLSRASGGPLALNSDIKEVGADGERDEYEYQVYEGDIARLLLKVACVPGVGTRRPREEHEDAYRKEHIRCASRKLHEQPRVYQTGYLWS
jgi:hypothetical protein